ncbi:ABC transporter permease subunit [Virgibacillus sp. FSP13]
MSLLIMGAGATLALIFFISLLRYLIAIPLAVFAANRLRFFRGLLVGWNQLLSGVPTIFIVMLLVLLPPILFTSSRPLLLVIVIALVEVGRVGKIFEEELVVISKKAYVESGVMVGCSPLQLFRRYYFPQIFGQIIVNFAMTSEGPCFHICIAGVCPIGNGRNDLCQYVRYLADFTCGCHPYNPNSTMDSFFCYTRNNIHHSIVLCFIRRTAATFPAPYINSYTIKWEILGGHMNV